MPLFRSGKPAVSVIQSVAQSIPAASATDLVFGTTRWAEGAGWDGVSTFTADRPGKYLFIANVGRAAAANSNVTVRARVNGSTMELALSVPTTAQFTQQLVTMLSLVAGDTVRCNVTFATGAAVLTVPSATSLIITRLGPERWT